MVPIYSVVIPVYNAEKYLRSCIECVLAQNTTSEFEIILVNDGSKDNSAQICDRYASQTSCIKVIHQSNQGVSVARNIGVAAAQGQYVLFLDADDLWDPALLTQLDAYLMNEPDIIEFGYRRFDGDHIRETVVPPHVFSGKSGGEYFESFVAINRLPTGSCWAAAFKRQLLQEYDLRFPLGVCYGEDLMFHMSCLKYAKNVYSICEPLYGYRENEASVTHTPSLKKVRDMLYSCAWVYKLFPCALFADYYCMKTLNVGRLSKADAGKLKDFLMENRDIFHHASGKKYRVIYVCYRLFGWYYASKMMLFFLERKNSLKGR